jgi:hypothetical protein
MDFTDCRSTTVETDADWTLVTTHGGTAAGRSSDMPGFEMLAPSAISEILAHVRTFCADSGWPHGNLNFPRSSLAVKAFPENELAMSVSTTHGETTNLRSHLDVAYARRVGKRAQLEVVLPAETVEFAGRRETGIGDVAVEGKYVVHADAARGTIASVGLETTFGTGSQRWGFGEGTAQFEPFLAAGITRGPWFLQGDIRGLLPLKRFGSEPVHHVAFNLSLLRPISVWPTAWTFGVAATSVSGSLSIAPEFVKGLTRTGSLTVGAAVAIPVRPVPPAVYGLVRWSGYLVWDYLEPLRARP